jgi:hypothetical protein
MAASLGWDSTVPGAFFPIRTSLQILRNGWTRCPHGRRGAPSSPRCPLVTSGRGMPRRRNRPSVSDESYRDMQASSRTIATFSGLPTRTSGEADNPLAGRRSGRSEKGRPRGRATGYPLLLRPTLRSGRLCRPCGRSDDRDPGRRASCATQATSPIRRRVSPV